MGNAMLTFLGTNDYLPCNYSLNGRKVNNVRFIQEAIAHLFCKDWSEEDRIIVFLTEDAKNINWVDNGHKDRDGKPLQRKGLKNTLNSLNLNAKIIAKDIPRGRSENEIWKIFDDTSNQINDGDEVIFDITHGFRSLPLLAIIILNYVRVLKNARISGVYYGAVESLGTIHDIEKMYIKDRDAPIFDLTPFIYLFDWTSAIDDFLTYGDARYINKLTKEEISPILKDTKGKDENAQNLRKLGIKLEKFTESIQTSRGLGIIKDFDFDNLRRLININEKSIIKPINPLLDRISNKTKNFNNKDVKNGYAAVEWCIKHNLIQQGYTLLQETMISEVVIKHFGENEIAKKNERELVSQAINIKNREIPEDEWGEIAKSNKDDVQRIMNGLDNDFVKIYDSVTQYRNDINHGGFKDNPSKPGDIKKRLEEYYEKVKGDTKYV